MGFLERGFTETCDIDDELNVFITTLNGAARDDAYNLAVVKEFIGNCYAELLCDTDILEDQLACLIAACRRGVQLIPRDALLGGAIDPSGCSACGRTCEQLVENGDGASSAHQEKTKAGPRPGTVPLRWRVD